jgi:ribosomal protein S18 acetylase RimI-like enzyme
MIATRPATTADAEPLSRLAEQTFRDAFAADNASPDLDAHCASAFSPEIQRGEILDPELVTTLALDEDRLVGFTQVRLGAAKDCVPAHRPSELYRLYVSRAWHGRGVAQALMEQVMDAASGFGSDRIWLGVWERNPRAIAFYKKYGFGVVGEHVFQFGSEPQRDLIMAAAIGGPPEE